MSGRFAVVLLLPYKKASGEGDVIYSGDDLDEAKLAMERVSKLPQNYGLILRLYDYALFGGGMKDFEIKAPGS